jgi:hypothetical protein
MVQQNQVTVADYQVRLARVRTSFSRLGDKWVLHYNTLHKDIIRFLLHDAKHELRGLFFHWMHGKDICAFLDYEEAASPFSADESDAILCHLEMYARFHPKAKGRTARTRIARNRRYAAELAGRVELCRAVQEEEQRNIANAPYDVRLLKRLDSISRIIRYDETDDLRKELATERDPYLRWILESVLGQPVSTLPPVEEPSVEPYAGTPLEQLAQQCRTARNLNRLEFRTWVCRAMTHKLHYFFIEELAILLIGVKKYHWDFREEPHPDECMPLAAWRERADEIISRPGTIERLELAELAAKIAAFIATAEELDSVAAELLVEREPDPLIRECLHTALTARGSISDRHEAIRRIEAIVADALCVIEAELRQGIKLYSLLNEPEPDPLLLEVVSSIPEPQLERINKANFAEQALPARVAYCFKRTRTYGMLSLETLDFVSSLKPEEPEEQTPGYFFDKEPYRLLSMMLRFFCDGMDGCVMGDAFTTILPIYQRNIALTAQLLTTSLAAWINGASAADVTSAIELCLLRDDVPKPTWATKRAYGEQWDLQEMKCFYFGGMRYPRGFMTERRRKFLAEIEVNGNGTVGTD